MELKHGDLSNMESRIIKENEIPDHFRAFGQMHPPATDMIKL